MIYKPKACSFASCASRDELQAPEHFYILSYGKLSSKCRICHKAYNVAMAAKKNKRKGKIKRRVISQGECTPVPLTPSEKICHNAFKVANG